MKFKSQNFDKNKLAHWIQYSIYSFVCRAHFYYIWKTKNDDLFILKPALSCHLPLIPCGSALNTRAGIYKASNEWGKWSLLSYLFCWCFPTGRKHPHYSSTTTTSTSSGGKNSLKTVSWHFRTVVLESLVTRVLISRPRHFVLKFSRQEKSCNYKTKCPKTKPLIRIAFKSPWVSFQGRGEFVLKKYFT